MSDAKIINAIPPGKVLLSVAVDDLKRIDADAKAAGMSRSAYLVWKARASNVDARVFDAINQLRAELDRFAKDHRGWQKLETELRDELETLNDRIRHAQQLLSMAEKLAIADKQNVGALRMISNVLDGKPERAR